MARRHVFLPGFPSVIFRVDSEIGGLPSDLPAVVKDLIAESRAAVQDGRLISPLGLAVVSGGHLSVTITNGYGERHWVTLCIRP
jgi:hypothetical protein